MRSWLFLIALVAFQLGLTGCDRVGGVCNQSGATDGCASGLICTYVGTAEGFNPSEPDFDPNAIPPAPLNVCLRQCETSKDCGEAELCRVVFCSAEIKSCQTGPLQEPPNNICGTDGTGGTGGMGGDGGMGGGGMGGDGGMGGGGTGGGGTGGDGGVGGDGGTGGGTGGTPGTVTYEQDFEGLDPAGANALEDDGWQYFGNVYDSTGSFKFGFGPFAAPTTSGQISGIPTGEGGPEQGDNQLVVFSNYDCCQPGEGHFSTDQVETIVFQEPYPESTGGIPLASIGQTFTFEFDAKRGNIEGSTTAQAFIKTIDPGAGFATTNNVPFDTTALPTAWGTYSISLDLTDPALEGQILQFGFSTIAIDFQSAGNFYDNIVATESPTP